MGRVFLSYSRGDGDITERIADVLRDLGIPYFQDEKDIEWGQDFELRIKSAIQSCAAVVVVISPQALSSSWIPYEIGLARAFGKRILPFIVEPSLVPTLDLPGISSCHYAKSMDEVRKFFSGFDVTGDAAAVAKQLQISIERISGPGGATIIGTWEGTAHQDRGPDGQYIDVSVTVKLHAAANAIEGEMVLHVSFDSKKRSTVCKVRGGLVDGRFAWLNYIPKELSDQQFGTLFCDLMRPEVNEVVVEFCGYGPIADGIVSGHARLRRVLPAALSVDREGDGG